MSDGWGRADLLFEKLGVLHRVSVSDQVTLVKKLYSANGGEEMLFVPRVPDSGKIAVFVQQAGDNLVAGWYSGGDVRALLPQPNRVWFCNLDPDIVDSL